MKMPPRELTKQEKYSILLVSILGHCLIRELDNVRMTNVYSQSIKQRVNQLTTALEQQAKRNVWAGPNEGDEFETSVNQMEDMASFVMNQCTVGLELSNIPLSDQQLFWTEMNQVFKRFKIPLFTNHKGEVQVLN